MMRHDARPSRRLEVAGDVLRGVTALVTLVGLVGGVPFALLRWGRWPITGLPTWDQVKDLPTTLVSDSTVLGIFTVALWVVWAVFTIAVLAEAVVQVRGRRRGPLPVPSPLQQLAGNLVGAVVVALGSFGSLSAATITPAHAVGSAAARAEVYTRAQVAYVDERPVEAGSPLLFRGVPQPDVLAQSSVAARPPVTPAAEAVVAPVGPPAAPVPAAVDGPVVEVRRGDSPWGLAEAHLGDGMRWREMWEANRTRLQPDGGVWANPDDAIRPGWSLVMPTGAAGMGVVAPIVGQAPAAPAEDVVVQQGDNFWDLAEGQLAETWGRAPTDDEVAPYWETTIDANRERLAPPRDADDIYPGEQFTLPAAPHDPLAPPPAPEPPRPTPPPPTEGPGDAPSAEAPAAPGQAPDAGAEAPEASAPDVTAPQATAPGATAPAPQAPADEEASRPEATTPAPPASVPAAPDATDQAPAPEAEAPAPAPAPDRSVPETTAPAPEAEAPAPGVSVPETTAPAPEAEAPAPGVSVPETTAPAPEAEAPDATGEAPAPEAESPAPAPEAPAPEAPAPEGRADVPEAEPATPVTPPVTAFPEAQRQPQPHTMGAPAPTPTAPPARAGEGTDADAAPTPEAEAPATTAPPAEAPTTEAPSAEAPATTAPPATATPGEGGREAPSAEVPTVPAPGQDRPGTTDSDAPADPSGPGSAAEDANEQLTDDEPGVPVPVGLIGGGLALAGLVVLLDRRRRAQLRRRRSGRRVAMPGAGLDAVERELRAGADPEAARLVDAALRAAAAGSGVGGPPELRWVEATTEHVTLVVATPGPAPRGFVGESVTRWRTVASADELAALGSSAASPAPALVPVGTTPDGAEVLVDLEASGVVTVTGEAERVTPFLRSVAVAAATAPWTEQPRVLLVGIGGELTALPWVESAETLGVALVDAENRAAEAVDALRQLQCQTTAQARAAGATPDAWEPLVVVSTRAPTDERYRVAALAARPGHAVAVVCPPGEAVHGRTLHINEGGWLTIDGVDLRVRARQLDEADTRAVAELLDLAGDLDDVAIDDAGEPEVRTPAPVDRDAPRAAVPADDEAYGAGAATGAYAAIADGHAHDPHSAPAAYADAVPAEDRTPADPAAADEAGRPTAAPAVSGEAGADTPDRPAAPAAADAGTVASARFAGVDVGAPSRLDELLADVDVVVRVLGDVEAVRRTADGEQRIVPGRQKALEAMTYLALREVPVDREDLEAVLFPTGANATKTFHNTVAAARTSLGDDLFPAPAGGRYELSEGVVTDYGLFHELVASAEEIEDAEEAADVLSEALTLVKGEPFTGAGRGYSWVSPHRGMIVAQVVDVAEEVAEIRLATGDWRAAEWAARQGLEAFPCDERMYRLLMRAAHAAGNVPGVQRVFRELCDMVADPEGGAEPEDTIHPETVALLDALTGGGGRGAVSA